MPVVDCVQAIAVGQGKGLAQESGLGYVSCASNSCVGGAIDSDGLVEGLDSGLRASGALASEIGGLSYRIADAAALGALAEAADWGSRDKLSSNRWKATSAVLGCVCDVHARAVF